MRVFSFKMAKFVVNTLVGSGFGRIGSLEIPILNSAGSSTILQTPGFMTHTLVGSVPHLTNEVLTQVFGSTPDVLLMSVDTTYSFYPSIKKSSIPVSQFVGMPTSPTFLLIHNPIGNVQPGYNNESGISFWTRHGRKNLSLKEYIDIVQSLKPSIYGALTDFDVGLNSNIKRMRKSFRRNLDYLDALLEAINPEISSCFAVIELGWFLVNEKEAIAGVKHILQRQDKFVGFLINGLEYNRDRNTNKLQLDTLEKIIQILPGNKSRFVPGNFSFKEVYDMINIGVDLFDSSSATKAVQKLIAFNIDFVNEQKQSKHRDITINEELPVRRETSDRTNIPPVIDCENSSFSQLNCGPISFHIGQTKFFADFRPLSFNCNCYTCRKFTRSYVKHLFTADELLGPLLLMIHNLVQLQKFYDLLRSSLSSGEESVKRLKEYLEDVSIQHEDPPTEDVNLKVEQDSSVALEVGDSEIDRDKSLNPQTKIT